MGKLKKQEDDIKTYTLTEREYDYLKVLNLATQFSTLRDKIISGFLYYVCNSRFGYSEEVNLVFEIDLEDDKREMKVREIPTEVIEKAMATEQELPKE